MMANDEFPWLIDDIKKNGLREPIITYEGKILDGRNRYRACVEAGVKPMFREYDPAKDGDSPVSFVISLNLQRRHLSSSQRAMIAGTAVTCAFAAADRQEFAIPNRPDEVWRGDPIHTESDHAVVDAKAVVPGTRHQRAHDSPLHCPREAASIPAAERCTQVRAEQGAGRFGAKKVEPPVVKQLTSAGSLVAGGWQENRFGGRICHQGGSRVAEIRPLMTGDVRT